MITYYGHSRHSIALTDRLLGQVRSELAAATWTALGLSIAERLTGPFDKEIARDFGIDAQCRFRFWMIDKENAHLYRPALIAAVYRGFGEGNLLVTWEYDSIVPPPDGVFDVQP